MSGWAVDGNCYDPDGFELQLDIDTSAAGVDSFCTSSNKCEHGFGDCDADNECVSGTTCRYNVGNAYGYLDNAVDVCVDVF